MISAARYVVENIQTYTGIEARETRLGYVQRGGTPSPMDRILATRYGSFATELIADGAYNNMVSVRGNDLVAVPLDEVGGRLRLVDPSDSLIGKARNLGVSFGDE